MERERQERANDPSVTREEGRGSSFLLSFLSSIGTQTASQQKRRKHRGRGYTTRVGVSATTFVEREGEGEGEEERGSSEVLIFGSPPFQCEGLCAFVYSHPLADGAPYEMEDETGCEYVSTCCRQEEEKRERERTDCCR
jgi:hypothetical protein